MSDSEPQIRLLACGKCRTVEELSDFEGPAEYDEVLAVAVARHQDGVERIPHAPAQLFKVAEKTWSVPEAAEQISKRIQESLDPLLKTTGLDAGAYAMVDNFRADALKCFEAHFRNPACNDYKIPEKRLVPDTKVERKQLGLNPRYDAQNPGLTKYLCDYCPVKSMVQEARFKKLGLYD